jgi:Rrf2 family protein
MMLEIARLGGEKSPVSLATVSGHSHLSRGYLEQLALALKNRGLLRGVCGKQGGYRLARRPDEITIGQIIEAAMGPVNIVECVGDPLSCLRSEYCECRPVYVLMNRRISEVLHGFTLAQMLDPTWVGSMNRNMAASAGAGQPPEMPSAADREG